MAATDSKPGPRKLDRRSNGYSCHRFSHHDLDLLAGRLTVQLDWRLALSEQGDGGSWHTQWRLPSQPRRLEDGCAKPPWETARFRNAISFSSTGSPDQLPTFDIPFPETQSQLFLVNRSHQIILLFLPSSRSHLTRFGWPFDRPFFFPPSIFNNFWRHFPSSVTSTTSCAPSLS